MKNRKVIYTCITNDYDILYEPTVINDNFDYVCFTDNVNCYSGSLWLIHPIHLELLSLSKVKQQRIIKICPHRYLQDYDISIWIDANINIIKDMECLTHNMLKSVYISKHPIRNCIYDEVNACLKLHKETMDNMSNQISRYSSEGYPKHYGLVLTGIIIRKHNTEYCKQLMEAWATELINGSHRDLLSFNYCLWKLGDSEFQYINMFNTYCKIMGNHLKINHVFENSKII